MVQPI